MTNVTAAISSKTFSNLLTGIEKDFRLKAQGSTGGTVSLGYDIQAKLDGGAITLNDDATIELTDIDIIWNPFTFTLCFNIPAICVGGFCLIPNPFDGCWLYVPQICIGPWSICVDIDLSGLTSEIADVKAGIVTKYFIDPARTNSESDLDAEKACHPNKWLIFLDPKWVHIDPIDVGDTVANLIENAFKNELDSALSFLPQWAIDLINAIIGDIAEFLRAILEAGEAVIEDLNKWFSDLLNIQVDIPGLIETAVAQFLLSQYPILQIQDPIPLLPETSEGLIPVKIPLRNLAVLINSHEMTIQADVGPVA